MASRKTGKDGEPKTGKAGSEERLRAFEKIKPRVVKAKQKIFSMVIFGEKNWRF
jgi:hypothetical protein